MSEPRLVFPPPIIYNYKVKTGNWFEEQPPYVRENNKHTSLYLTDYQKKPLSTHPRSLKWDFLIRDQRGTPVFYRPERTTDKIPNYHDNYATTYDLSYKHLPKMFPIVEPPEAPKLRRFGMPRRDPELIESYGSITNFGLMDAKKEEWKCENSRRRSTSLPMTKIDYGAPPKADYIFSRWQRYRPIPKKTADIYPNLDPDHPRLSICNPLTWECRDKKRVIDPPNYQLPC